MDHIAPLQISPVAQRRRAWPVRKFQGTEKPANWDGLHKDPELWFDDGDCVVHFYAPGASRRGPSLRVHYADVKHLQSPFLDRCLRFRDQSSATSDTQSITSSADERTTTSSLSDSVVYELYIPAPPTVARGQAYTYHLTTRNCFALASNRPIVGERLSTALTELWQRLNEWQAQKVTFEHFTGQYCRRQGYTHLSNHPDHALACLIFAENVRSRHLYIDAFAHCVGMQQRLYTSQEFDAISDHSAILVTKASLEMSLHIPRAVRAVGSFLEEELGSERLGLTKPARDHLDRFRCCLFKYYVEAFGYFPPSEEGTFNKRLWTKMYHPFRHLYSYLADQSGSSDKTGMSGGFCVLQNVQAFDKRHGFAPLPHATPLLPATAAKQSRRLTLDFRRRHDPAAELRIAIETATNTSDGEVMACPLVQEYQRFERQKMEDKLTVIEARKVRWMLIYATLQMLTSIVCAPKEVRDADSSPYPMCVLTAGCPPWNENEAKFEPQMPTHDIHESEIDGLDARPSVDKISIHPDCEVEGAEAFFKSRARSETRQAKTSSRSNSIFSNVGALQRSVVGSLARRNTLSGKTTALLRRRPVSMFAASSDSAEKAVKHDGPSEMFDFDIKEEDGIPEAPALDRSSSQSSNSTVTASSPVSGRSSYSSAGNNIATHDSGDEDYSPITEVSSNWDEHSAKKLSTITTPTTPTSVQSYHPSMALNSTTKSVSGGCYRPTGIVEQVDSQLQAQKRPSLHQRVQSVLSTASSEYSDDEEEQDSPKRTAVEVQADDEEEFRGRRRHRRLDRMTESELTAFYTSSASA